MAGISSKAAGRMQNNKKYNGIEFDNDLDLNTYEAFYRNLDPQIGRWWQIDPKVDAGYESISPYASMYDDPIRFSDPLGDEAGDDPPKKGVLETLGSGFMRGAEWINSNINPLTPVVESILGTSYESGFTESKSRATSIAEVGISLIPGGKVEGAIIKQVEKAVVNQEEKQLVQVLEKNFAKTEPKLPSKTVVKDGSVEVIHYTKSGDHAPAHLHVKGGGAETKIGQNGKPIKGSNELTSVQKQVVIAYKQEIRKAVKQIMKWFNFNKQ